MKQLPILLFLLLCNSVSFAQLELVKDVFPGVNSSDPLHLTLFNNKLYFTAVDSAHGRELWASESNSQTSIVKDMIPGTKTGVPFQNYSARNAVVSGRLYFCGNDSTKGYELYQCDSSNNITLAADIKTGILSSFPIALTALNGKLYFFATTAADGYELYEYDPATTIATIRSNIGTGAKSAIKDTANASICVYDNKLYFAARDSLHGQELYHYDPATLSTTIVYEATGDTSSSYPRNFLVAGSKLYFSATTSPFGRELYAYNASGVPQKITDVRPGPGDGIRISDMVLFKGQIIFAGSNGSFGFEPWTLDTTTYATAMIADISLGPSSSAPDYFHEYHNKLYFAAGDDTVGYELRCWDGITAPRTAIDIYAGYGSSIPLNFVTWGNYLYFNAATGATGYELYRLDDTHLQVENLSASLAMKVYPNPVNDVVHFGITAVRDVKGTMTIRDVSGKVCDNVGIDTNHQTEWTVDMSRYSCGTYFYELRTSAGGLIVAGKLLKAL